MPYKNNAAGKVYFPRRINLRYIKSIFEFFTVRVVRSVKQFVSLMRIRFAEELFVKFNNLLILVRKSVLLHAVFFVKRGGSLLFISIENVVVFVRHKARLYVRLSAARNATAGTTHDFDELIRTLARPDFVEQYFRILHSVRDRDSYFGSAEIVSRFFYAVKTSYVFDFGVCEFFTREFLRRRPKSRFHNAARRAEDNARAGIFADYVVVEFLFRESVPHNTRATDNSRGWSERRRRR